MILRDIRGGGVFGKVELSFTNLRESDRRWVVMSKEGAVCVHRPLWEDRNALTLVSEICTKHFYSSEISTNSHQQCSLD